MLQLLSSFNLLTPFMAAITDMTQFHFLFVVVFFTLTSAACNSRSPFCPNELVQIDRQAADLVSRLTLDEKISLLGNTAPAIPRLNIPAYEWWSEALHGVSNYGRGVPFSGSIAAATSFPQVILSAATFDAQLWYRIGQATGNEGRAMYNAGQAKGAAFWTPNVNIFRDPRWGRGQETPGEDPVVAARYAAAYVRGIQGFRFDGAGDHKNQLLVSACCKHFTAYDLEDWNGVQRYSFDAKVTPQDLADTYQPPFRSCVEDAKASGLMCSYNSVNGVPACADSNLLTRVVRQEWHFRGYIVSDCDAVSSVLYSHKYTKSPEETVASVLKAGVDVECGTFLYNYTKSALDQNRIVEEDINRALRNSFAVRMRLGLFDGNQSGPYAKIGVEEVCKKEHQDLALDAARNGIVLLKNANDRLPLSNSTSQSIALFGPSGNNAYFLMGIYGGPPCASPTVLSSLQDYVKNIVYQPGCNSVNCTTATIDDAVKAAEQADDVILVMGLDQTLEGETHDRVELTLPGLQENLIKAVAAAAKKPVILVLVCGGPVDVSFAKDDPKVGTIMWAGYPGEAGGAAIAQIIFGDHNPGGKLPMTWYPKDFVKVPMTDMRMRADPASGYPGRTYRFYNGSKVFDFGFGLSYTTHSYKFHQTTLSNNTLRLNTINPMLVQDTSYGSKYVPTSKIDTLACENTKFSTKVRVKNTGNVASKHPVLLFMRQGGDGTGKPLKELVGFEPVNLKAGEGVDVEFVLDPCKHLSNANEEGVMVIEAGSKYLVVEDQKYLINVVL